MNTPKLGILVAKLILAGDLHRARLEANGRKHWSIPEARAIAGACRVVQAKGWPVTFEQFV